MKSLSLLVLGAMIAVAVNAQTDDPNDLFTGSGVVESPLDPAASTAAQQSLVKTKEVTLGGRVSSDATALMVWPDAYPAAGASARDSTRAVLPHFESDLWFDARPADDFRVFGKFRLAYPFDGTSQTWTVPPAYLPASASHPGVSVFELYSDVSWRQTLFLRAGQQVAHWGVGTFFSPADVLSLEPLSALDPQRERPGPLALKATVPWGDANSAQLVVLRRPGESAAASKVDLVVGDFEWSLGGYWPDNNRPKALITTSGSLAGRWGVYGEAVVQRGADIASAEAVYVLATVGLNYIDSAQHLTVNAQYLENGPGYDSLSQEQAVRTSTGTDQPLGRRYAAGSAAWTDIRASNIDLTVFLESNLSDGSGLVAPSVGYTPFTRVRVTLTPRVTYGRTGSELVSAFGFASVALNVSVGSDEF